MTFCVFLVVCYVFSCFLTCFVTMCWLSKRWANLQTQAKPCSPQNIPNTVPEWSSRLIVSVTFDDFYRTNQTFWCSIVGVFLIETHKNTKFLKLFSKQYCIDSTFIFHVIVLIFSRLLKALLEKINYCFQKILSAVVRRWKTLIPKNEKSIFRVVRRCEISEIFRKSQLFYFFLRHQWKPETL